MMASSFPTIRTRYLQVATGAVRLKPFAQLKPNHLRLTDYLQEHVSVYNPPPNNNSLDRNPPGDNPRTETPIVQ